MKLIVLGSGTSIAHAQRASPAFWLETGAGSILLDCSVDAPHRMAEENLDWPNLDAIWISHLHLDHFGGLAPFLFGVKWAASSDQRTKPLIIFGCLGVERLLKTVDEAGDYKLFHQSFPIQFHEIAPSESSRAGEILGIRIGTISTFHRPESLALHVTDSAGTTLV